VQVGPSQMRGFDFASATGNMLDYQAKLLEMTQANMRFAVDFSRKLATIRSPFQFVDVIAEFIKGGPTCWGSSQQKWPLSQVDDFKPFPAAPDG